MTFVEPQYWLMENGAISESLLNKSIHDQINNTQVQVKAFDYKISPHHLPPTTVFHTKEVCLRHTSLFFYFCFDALLDRCESSLVH